MPPLHPLLVRVDAAARLDLILRSILLPLDASRLFLLNSEVLLSEDFMQLVPGLGMGLIILSLFNVAFVRGQGGLVG